MSSYSLEPSRTDCIVHHTFDFLTEQSTDIVDISPQANDGQIVGTVEPADVGVIGPAARLDSDDARIDVADVSQYFPMPSTTVSSWVRSKRAVPQAEDNLQATLVVGGTHYTLSHNVNEAVDYWQFGALDYDGSEAKLYYGTLDKGPVVVDEVSVSGDADDVDLQFNTESGGWIDDVRLYRRNLGSDAIADVHQIAAEHNTTDEFGDAWDNNGIPFFGNNRQFAGTLGERDETALRQIDAIRDARHINYAGGEQLDRIGNLIGLRRDEGEADGVYRARLKGEVITGRSSGTFADILSGTTSVLNTTTDRVEVDENYGSHPATAFISIRQSDLDDSALTGSQLVAILKDIVFAGHDIEIRKQTSANTFTVTSNSMANDPSQGLTSDTTSSGGELVEDIP